MDSALSQLAGGLLELVHVRVGLCLSEQLQNPLGVYAEGFHQELVGGVGQALKMHGAVEADIGHQVQRRFPALARHEAREPRRATGTGLNLEIAGNLIRRRQTGQQPQLVIEIQPELSNLHVLRAGHRIAVAHRAAQLQIASEAAYQHFARSWNFLDRVDLLRQPYACHQIHQRRARWLGLRVDLPPFVRYLGAGLHSEARRKRPHRQAAFTRGIRLAAQRQVHKQIVGAGLKITRPGHAGRLVWPNNLNLLSAFGAPGNAQFERTRAA